MNTMNKGYHMLIFMTFALESSIVPSTNGETKCVKLFGMESHNASAQPKDLFEEPATQTPATQVPNLAALPASDRMSVMRKESMKQAARKDCKAQNGIYYETTGECAIYNVTYMNETKCTTKILIKQKVAISQSFLSPTDEKRLTLGGMVISEISLIVLLATYWFCKDLQTPYGKCVVILSITTMIEHLLPIISMDQKNNLKVCTGIAICHHWVTLVMFCWMASIAFDLYQTFAKIRPPSAIDQRRRFKAYLCVSESVPAFIVITCIIIDFSSDARYIGYGLHGICFITGYWPDIITFVIPVGFALTFNLTCMCVTLIRIRKAARKSETLFNKNNKSSKPSLSFAIIAMKLAFLLGLSWVFGYLGSLLQSVTLLYIFLIVNSYQGALIFIAFCCNQKVFRFYKSKFSYFFDRNSISTNETSSKRESQQTTV